MTLHRRDGLFQRFGFFWKLAGKGRCWLFILVRDICPASPTARLANSGEAKIKAPESGIGASGIESLILSGVTTHVCVHTTLREANDRGYECLVLEDATAAFDLQDHEAAIRMVHQQGGIFGWVSDCKSFLYALEQRISYS